MTVLSSTAPAAPAAVSAPHPDDPRTIGPYRVLGVLGAGGMARSTSPPGPPASSP